MNTYLCVYLGAALLGLVLTPLVIDLGKTLKVLDYPGLRKVHNTPIPRLGGLVIAGAMLAMMVCVLSLDNVIGQRFRQIHTQVLALLGSATFMLFVGLIDDVRGLRAYIKFLAGLAAAITVCNCGIRIDSFSVGGWFSFELGWLAWPVTILWIVGITNAVNLIDGLDGLAAGICAVACGVIFAFAIYSEQPLMAVLMLGLLGSLTSFLFFNFNPAKIFMGDGGSYFLGFILAAGSVMSTAKAGTIVGLALPALALGLPIFDTLFSMIRRVLERRSIFSPDRGHLHHRLLDMGLRHRHVVIFMYAVTLAAAGLGMLMMVTRNVGMLVIFACVLLLLVLVFRFAGQVRLREMLAIVQQNYNVSQKAGKDKRYYEEAQLRFNEVRSFKDWWSAVCAAAKGMDFQSITLPLTNRDGTVRILSWSSEKTFSQSDRMLRMSLPICDRRSGPPPQAELKLPIEGSLEITTRKAAMFGRLMDKHGIASLSKGVGMPQCA